MLHWNAFTGSVKFLLWRSAHQVFSLSPLKLNYNYNLSRKWNIHKSYQVTTKPLYIFSYYCKNEHNSSLSGVWRWFQVDRRDKARSKHTLTCSQTSYLEMWKRLGLTAGWCTGSKSQENLPIQCPKGRRLNCDEPKIPFLFSPHPKRAKNK